MQQAENDTLISFICIHDLNVLASHQYVKPMNFEEEVRAHRDLDGFLAQASILLDEKAATLDEVLRRMLTHVVVEGRESWDVDEIMNSLFTDAGRKEIDGERACYQRSLNQLITLKATRK